jgi:hypothetical protein
MHSLDELHNFLELLSNYWYYIEKKVVLAVKT